ncbi:MAG: Ca-activated chloride channel [Chthoniobacter sp.]|jgi:Ca-activated chloride channel family protein|nr:Ca-activated chloride channel [Chthoniobacter sp.]
MSSGLTFAHPWLLLLLLLLPLLALLRGGRGAAPAVIFSSLEPLRSLGKISRARAGGWLTSLLLLALALFIIALARPQQGRVISHVEASGIDIMLLLDVSRSMLAEDFSIGNERANRLAAVKQVTEKFIEGRPNDRIGILCFAGRPYLVSPLTLDHDWLLQNLERVRIGLVEDGTAIGSAIASAANRLKDKEAKSKIIVLLTDGDNNAGKITPVTAAEAAKALGIKIHTICAGTKGFAPVPVQDMFGRTMYRNIKVEVDETALKQIAQIANGEFYRATDSKTLKQIFERIDELEKSTVELSQYKQYRDLFPWFLATGFALLGLQMVLAQTVGRKLP